MAKSKVKVGQDGQINFEKNDHIPTTVKKFRQSPEIEGFYRFVYQNDLREEAFLVLNNISANRKLAAKEAKASAKKTKKK